MITFTTAHPNEPILIYKGDFELRGGKRPISVNGSISIEWLPQPSLQFGSGQFSHDDANVLLRVMPDFGSIDIVEKHGHFACELSGKSITLRAYPKTQEQLNEEGIYLGFALSWFDGVRGSDSDRVLFHIANLAGLHQRESRGSVTGIKSLLLHGGGCRVEIKPARFDRGELFERGGFALTHVGTLEREDKQLFSKDEATDFLEGLRYFLSFARGRWCWPCLYIGTRSCDFSWFHCGQPMEIDQVIGHSPYLFSGREEVMTATFAGFLALWSGNEWRKPLETMISWYVEANRAESMESAIVAAQTALELVAWIYAVERRKTLSPEGFDQLPASDRFRLLLSLEGIPVDFPSYAKDLSSYSSQPKRRWPDGPTAIVGLRNSIVHPRRRENLIKHQREFVSRLVHSPFGI